MYHAFNSKKCIMYFIQKMYHVFNTEKCIMYFIKKYIMYISLKRSIYHIFYLKKCIMYFIKKNNNTLKGAIILKLNLLLIN